MFRRTQRGVLILLLIVAGCGQTAPTPTATYRGQPLPTPRPRSICDNVCPPAAWLIVGDELIEASYGAFTTQMHTDPAVSLMKEHITAATLPAETPMVIVVNSASITRFGARRRPWDKDPLPYLPTAGQLLQAEAEQTETTSVFTVEHFDEGGEQLLHVVVTFPVELAPAIGATGEATYFWRMTGAN